MSTHVLIRCSNLFESILQSKSKENMDETYTIGENEKTLLAVAPSPFTEFISNVR